MINKAKAQKLLNKLSTLDTDVTEAFDPFDTELASLTSKLKETLAAKTMEQIKSGFADVKTLVPKVLDAIETLKSDISERDQRATQAFSTREDEIVHSVQELVTKQKEAMDESTFTLAGYKGEIDALKESIGATTATTTNSVKGLQDSLGSLAQKIKEALHAIDERYTKRIGDTETILTTSRTNTTADLQKLSDTIEAFRTEFITKLANVGGGNMNRQILVEGVNPLTTYTDINIYGVTSSVITSVDTVHKRVNIGIRGGGGGSGMAIGDLVVGADFNRVLFTDGASALAQADNFQFNGSTMTIGTDPDFVTLSLTGGLNVTGPGAFSGDVSGSTMTANIGTFPNQLITNDLRLGNLTTNQIPYTQDTDGHQIGSNSFLFDGTTFLTPYITSSGANALWKLINTNDSATKNGFFQVTYDGLEFGYSATSSPDYTAAFYVGKAFEGGTTRVATTLQTNVTSASVLSNILDDGFGNMGIGNKYPQSRLHIGTSGSIAGTVRMSGSIAGTVVVQPASVAGDWIMTLPGNKGTAGQYLITDGNGITQWASVVATGGSGITRTTSVITANTTGGTTANTDYVYFATTGVRFNLPSIAGAGTNMYTVKNMSVSSVIVVSSEGIDGGPTALLALQNQSLSFIPNGSIYGVV